MLPRSCSALIPPSEVYDPVDRPRGIRCDLFDNEINVYGRDPTTGRAARPVDNIGVQYGFSAFNEGKISCRAVRGTQRTCRRFRCGW